jgi:hypothetical protein
MKRSPIKRNVEKIRKWLDKSRKKAASSLRRTAPLSRSTNPIKIESPIAKKAKRKASWYVVDGVRIFLKTGREVCITDAAWSKRRLECCRYYDYECQCGCKIKTFAIVSAFDAHHLHGRGRGRDDRIMVKGKPNLVPLLRDHHMKEHNQEWSKGELQWQSVRQQN